MRQHGGGGCGECGAVSGHHHDAPFAVLVGGAPSCAGFKPEDYAGHSFRIGAATMAAACGVPVDTIKTLGRWKTQAYQLYVRLPRKQLARLVASWWPSGVSMRTELSDCRMHGRDASHVCFVVVWLLGCIVGLVHLFLCKFFLFPAVSDSTFKF